MVPARASFTRLDWSARILKGESSADLPIELPAHYELIVNLKAAKAIGLTIPDSFMLLADEAIE
jgi:putative tryptophan/tyrosine transport system substrate-binding protein